MKTIVELLREIDFHEANETLKIVNKMKADILEYIKCSVHGKRSVRLVDGKVVCGECNAETEKRASGRPDGDSEPYIEWCGFDTDHQDS